MTVRGIEAIKLYMPPTKEKIDINIKEEKGVGVCSETDTNNQTLSGTMSSVERYRQEWEQLLYDLDQNPQRIQDLAYNGELKGSKFRSISWALLLRVLNTDYRSWKEQRDQQRQRYEKLQQEFIKNPHEMNVLDDDPLSQSTQSVWNQYFSDQDLFSVIRQDVVRTFPGVDFFRKPIMQDAMTNILFYYAREHPYMCYRQGMHEILAPILFVKYNDHQSLLQFQELAKTTIDATLLDCLNPAYLEADTYSIFSRVMASIESYYRITNLVQGANGFVPITTEDATAVITTEVEVIGQLNLIRDKILAKEDLHLHNHLLKLDIPLHIFGIRWLRLLFGREFPLLDLLVLWDAIFADSDRFDLPNYILVAMLIRIRDKLLLSDYTTCLTYLMRYPVNVDLNLILRHALHMYMPKKFDCPPNAFIYFTMQPNSAKNGTTPNQAATSASSSTSTKNTAIRRQQQLNYTNSQEKDSLQSQRTRNPSLGKVTVANVEKEINLLQTLNAADTAAKERFNVIKNESDRIIMDGYAENSPELMRLELKNAQTVIKIARSKLLHYLSIVRKQVSLNNSDELENALDGIEELCSFLDVKFMFPLHTRTLPIDSALEANEQLRQMKQLSIELSRKSLNRNDSIATADMAWKSEDIEEDVRPTPIAISESSLHETFNLSRDNNQTFATTNTAPSSNALGATTVYEKPDSSFRFNTMRALGNLREIELIPIASDEKVVEPITSSFKKPKNGKQQSDENEPPLAAPK